ncbi:MAG: hypothetical protein H7A33_05960 [Deltaproteobacteria bacterium]|nr:hypothetical protein [Deltaproteobacteria bacterium]
MARYTKEVKDLISDKVYESFSAMNEMHRTHAVWVFKHNKASRRSLVQVILGEDPQVRLERRHIISDRYYLDSENEKSFSEAQKEALRSARSL